MRLVDASVFVYAFVKPRRKLKPHGEEMKKNAKKIVSRIS